MESFSGDQALTPRTALQFPKCNKRRRVWPIPPPMLFDGCDPMRQSLLPPSPPPPRPQMSQPGDTLFRPAFFQQPRAPVGRHLMPQMVLRGVRVLPPPMRHYDSSMPPPPPPMMPPIPRPRFLLGQMAQQGNSGNVKDKVMANTKIKKFEVHLQLNNKGPHNQRSNNNVGSEDNPLYYCGTCDRYFSSESTLIEHKNTHKLCGIDGCTFSAHPLLVEKHINMQHSTGLYARMKDLSGEEGAKKWAEERRKRFPTKNNIKLREAENLEKLQRGEIIKQDRHVLKSTNMRTTNTHGKKRKPHRRSTRKIDNCPDDAGELYRGLRPFPGINSYLQEETSTEVCLDEKIEQVDSHKEIVDDISDEDDDIPQVLVESKPTNLSTPSLVANYGSESEEEGNSPEEVSIKRIKMDDLQNHKLAENVTVLKDSANDVQPCTSASENKSDYQITNISKISRQSVNKHQDTQKHKTNQTVEDKREKMSNKYCHSLLQMLLTRSIQHERNLISQCLKYIVDNNFFESSESRI